jgi:GNAT superfamily N-acetyltransferase
MENITQNLEEYRKRLETFLDELESEREFFNLTLDRVMKWELVVVEILGNRIIGIGGLERKFGICRSNVMVKKEFHRKGLGERLLVELLSESKQNHNIVWAVIGEHNTGSLKLHQATGYRMVGRRQSMYYFVSPLNSKGKVMLHLVEAFFPLLRVVDMIRR